MTTELCFDQTLLFRLNTHNLNESLQLNTTHYSGSENAYPGLVFIGFTINLLAECENGAF